MAATAAERANVASGNSSPLDPLYVEVSCLLEENLTGIGRFAARLTEGLARIAPLRLFTTGSDEDIDVRQEDLADADMGLDAWARRLFKNRRRPHDSRLASRCAALFTALRPGVRHFRREIGILYDFTALLLPWAHAWQTREHFGNFFGETSARCDKLLAISGATKHDASWLCAAADEHVVVGYPGPSMCVRRHAHAEPVQRRENVILVVSTLEPRKNTRFLLDWFSRSEAVDPETELWWVGPKGWWTPRELLRDLSFQHKGKDKGRIRFLGMVSDGSLCELYRQATFTIYPSLYEGFGFPVLDSLLHGTPVVCSFNSSLKEFAGPGVFFFDACQPATLDDAIRNLLASQPVHIDADALRERHSWDVLARKVMDMAA